jgi:hypothetical protein
VLGSKCFHCSAAMSLDIHWPQRFVNVCQTLDDLLHPWNIDLPLHKLPESLRQPIARAGQRLHGSPPTAGPETDHSLDSHDPGKGIYTAIQDTIPDHLRHLGN